jgi:eukaryotic-like serine/threonine-protein kinase
MSRLTSKSFASRLLGNHLLSEEQLARAVAAVGDKEADLADYLVREGLLTRFQARQLRAGSASLTVGNYVVIDFLGRGGNGIVLKACHRLMPGRFVALKTLETRNLHASSDVVARFRREIQIVTRLDHPNVVRALDVVQTRTQLFLVLEYVAGPNLAVLVQQRGPLPVAEAVDYALQVAHGLAYAHQQGIVHRDLKPTNLLLAEGRVVKIADMGLARFFESSTDMDLTMKGLAIGTPEYMAPEQAEDASVAGPASDIYSLGATLFHLLTGTPSIEGSSYFHKLQRLLTAPPRPLAELRKDTPPELAALVDGCAHAGPKIARSRRRKPLPCCNPSRRRPVRSPRP